MSSGLNSGCRRILSSHVPGPVYVTGGVADLRVDLAAEHPSPPAPPAAPGLWSDFLHDRWPGAVGWTGGNVSLAETATTSPITRCGVLGTFFGGFEKFGMGAYVEKALANLPTHTGLRFRFTWLKVDQWQGNKGQLCNQPCTVSNPCNSRLRV